MSKQVRTLSRIATACVSFANAQAAQRVSRAALTEMVKPLTLIEKQRVDAEIVQYYAAKTGVLVAERSREAKGNAVFYCNLVAKFERNGTDISDPAQKAAQTAISELRKIIFAAEIHGDDAPVKATPFAKLATSLLKRAAKGEALNAAEKRDARKLMLALVELGVK